MMVQWKLNSSGFSNCWYKREFYSRLHLLTWPWAKIRVCDCETLSKHRVVTGGHCIQDIGGFLPGGVWTLVWTERPQSRWMNGPLCWGYTKSNGSFPALHIHSQNKQNKSQWLNIAGASLAWAMTTHRAASTPSDELSRGPLEWKQTQTTASFCWCKVKWLCVFSFFKANIFNDKFGFSTFCNVTSCLSRLQGQTEANVIAF